MAEWVSCEDRMPEPGVFVLVFGPEVGNECCAVAAYVPGRSYDPWDLSCVNAYQCELAITPTHWMPLPAPPGSIPVHRTSSEGFVEDWTELRHMPGPILATVTDPLEPGSVVQIADANGVPIWYRVGFCNRRPDGSLHDLGLILLIAP